MKKALLLINLGTPAALTKTAVKQFLNEFLLDPYVITLPALLRYILVKFIILPTRTSKSLAAYAKIWTADGSPLSVYSKSLSEKVQAQLGSDYHVELAMRYGQPSIQDALEKFKANDIDEVLAIPMYPQYAESSTQTAIDHLHLAIAKISYKPKLTIKPAFYHDPAYITVLSEMIAMDRDKFQPEHILFSYHGLPAAHLIKLNKSCRACLKQKTCQQTNLSNCYRAQCSQTTKLLAEKLNLAEDSYSMSFQSRLGRAEWVKPYTEHTVVKLAEQGVKNLLVVAPAFTVDCIETLEEIAIAARELFIVNGGQELQLVPCLNDSQEWVEVIANYAKNSV